MTSSLRAILRRTLAAAICASSIAGPAAALAQPKPKAPATTAAPAPPSLSTTLTGMAKAEFEAAKILYQDGDIANAIVKFQHAYDLSKDPRLLWNIAVCEKNLRRYSRMLKAIERYQRDGGALLSEQDRKDAAELEKTVRALVSAVTLKVSEDGADILVDGVKVGKSPLTEPLLLDVGSRTVRVTKPGFKEFVRIEKMVGGTEVNMAALLEREIHQGQLIVEAGPKDVIFLDGKAVGQGKWEGLVSSGGHTLRVTAPGMEAYQSEVVIQDNKSRRIPVTLEAARGSTTSTLLWVGGGTLLVVGAVVGGIFLFQPASPTVTDGTIGPKTVQTSYRAVFTFGGSL
jgi:hypothetical protein